MKPIALVIEDDPEIRAALMDRLESLGHDQHPAGCQLEARERLARCSYTYVLLDLELPVRYGRTPLIQTGKNLLDEIRASERHAATPVIVVTAHGHDRPDLAVEVMKAGATDFVKKPFGGLETAITEAIGGNGNGARKAAAPKDAPPEPESRQLLPLENGRMAFYQESIELEGVVISTPDSGTVWRMLNILRERRPDGRPRSFPGKKLAEMLGLDRGQNAICDALSFFRRRVIDQLRDVGIEAGEDSVVITGRAGYELNRELRVENHSEEPSPKIAEEDPAPTTDDRQAWILAQLKARKKVKRKDVEEHFDVSSRTAKRDFAALADKVEFTGPGASGYYRLKSRVKQKSLSL